MTGLIKAGWSLIGEEENFKEYDAILFGLQFAKIKFMTNQRSTNQRSNRAKHLVETALFEGSLHLNMDAGELADAVFEAAERVAGLIDRTGKDDSLLSLLEDCYFKLNKVAERLDAEKFPQSRPSASAPPSAEQRAQAMHASYSAAPPPSEDRWK